MWAENAVIYQIYPLGLCGAPYENDGILSKRLAVLDDSWIEHIKKLGVDTVLFNPLFESDTHGYNTRDYRKVDCRLGTNEDFKELCDKLHSNGMKVMLDGVFNHVGRGFAGFEDVLKNRWESKYSNWFHINFDGNNSYNDGLWYEGWEGNYDLVKLNLDNYEVCDYLMDSVRLWIDEFDIDGLRLDVAYMVNRNFLKRLREQTSAWKKDFFLFGEMLGGDYKQILNDEMCHSVTNYECFKGIFSAINSRNLFEIIHSLLRQFGKEPWCLYTGKNLISFVDNHDVTRIASNLQDERDLPIAYTIMYAMPGIPCIYYGSEWGIKGDKSSGDQALRPMIEKPQWNSLCDHIKALSEAKRNEAALTKGDFKSLVLENRHCIFERQWQDERIMTAINIDDEPCVFHFNANAGRAHDLITGEVIDFGGGLEVPGHTSYVLKPF